MVEYKENIGERNSVVEYELPKLDTGVRFPSLAPFCRAKQRLSLGYGFAAISNRMKLLIAALLLLSLAGCKTAQTAYTADTQAVGGVYHYVKVGETLWGISKLYGVDMNTILNANNLYDAKDIERGQRLLIPGKAARHEREETQKKFSYNDFFIWPLKGNVVSYYGSKLDRTKNKGIDIRAAEGSSVRASRSGKVVFSDEGMRGFGKTVILDHGDNFQTVYAYNSLILVTVGDVVEKNTVIAKVGRSGRAKEPSLHFEIRRDGEPQNPFYYLSR